MAPGQNTFSIIPNAPCAINGGDLDDPRSRSSKPPMTSKQAKKAYQKSSKGPKLSKAEQRRQDLFEQDRIRREFEKERNQARARAARDKKKEKEERERAEKKKKGLPLVEVHPSQDTIAWFVRGDGRKKKKQESQAASFPVVPKDDNDSCTLSPAEGEPGPPPKKQKTEHLDPVSGPSFTGDFNGSLPEAHRSSAQEASQEVVNRVENLAGGHSEPDRLNFDMDDSIATGLVHDEPSNESISVTGDTLKDDGAVPDSRDRTSPTPQINNNSPSPSKASGACPHLSPPTKELSEQKVEDSASPPSVPLPLQSLDENAVNAKAGNKPSEPAPNDIKLAAPLRTATTDSLVQAPRASQPSVSTSRSFPPHRTPMGPPPVPQRLGPHKHLPAADSGTPASLFQQTCASIPRFTTDFNHRPPQSNLLQTPREERLPTSTQLLLLDHLDDFFPSPSQEVRELFEESKLSVTVDATEPKAKPTHMSRSAVSGNRPNRPLSTISTPNRLAPVISDNKAEPRHTQKDTSSIQDNQAPSFVVANIQSSGDSDIFDIPFFSTQDFVLSSQDIKDLEDETTSPFGVERGEQICGSPNGTGSYSRSSAGINRAGHHGTCLTASTFIPNKEQDEGSGLGYERGPTNSKVQPIRSGLPSHSTRHSKSHTPAPNNAPLLYSRVGNDSLHSHNNRSTTDPLDKQAAGAPDAPFRNYANRTSNTQQTREDAAQPHASPRPFLTSNQREVHSIYANERRKTTAWEGISARGKVREELEHLQKSEDKRDKRPHMSKSNSEAGCGGTYAVNACASSSGLKAATPTARSQNRPQGRPQPRSINQLSSSAEGTTQSQKINEPSEERRRRDQSRSSYEKMLELLERRESNKQEQQTVPASQETDYGDAGLDDVLCEML